MKNRFSKILNHIMQVIMMQDSFILDIKMPGKITGKVKKKSLVISNSNAVDVDNYDDFKLLKMIYDFSKKIGLFIF